MVGGMPPMKDMKNSSLFQKFMKKETGQSATAFTEVKEEAKEQPKGSFQRYSQLKKKQST